MNKRYKELQKDGDRTAHQKLKAEFQLTTSEVWELLGIKDELDSKDQTT